MEYDNTNRIVMFENKKENEKQPDINVLINIEGKEYKASVWLTPEKKTFGSGKVQSQEEAEKYQKKNPAMAKPQVSEDEAFDDDIPF